MKYSVIIPIYKAEATLERCLDSLLRQPHDDVELLLINDGSPDGSGAICEKYAEEYPCIRYFSKENGGVSSARNLGLEEATGEYILFVDSDDYVSPDYFDTIDRALDEHKPDMLLFGYRSFGGSSSAWNNGSYFVDDTQSVAEKAAQSIRAYLFCSLWSKVFRREIIEKNKIHFDNGLAIGEDQLFILRYAMNIKNLLSIHPFLYNLCTENTDSLSRKRRDYLTEQLLKSNLAMLDALKGSELPENAKKTYGKALVWIFYRGAYSSCKELLKYELSARERRKKIREICRIYRECRVKLLDIKCCAIAAPVWLGTAFAMDLLIRNR